MKKTSAGILLFRKKGLTWEVLLGHMGGPFWRKKDEASWTIPKGEFDPSDEDSLDAACREFEEETGHRLSGSFIELTPIVQSGGKQVYAWAVEGDLQLDDFVSNTFEMEWPPRSGKMETFPELDRVGWYALEEAKNKILKGQRKLIDQLDEILKKKVKVHL